MFYDEEFSEVIATSGPPCSDEDSSCQEDYEAVVTSSRGFECHWLLGPLPVSLIVADGGGFTTFDSHELLLAFFGSIDTPLEARIWLWTRCESVSALRETETGYEVIVDTIEEYCWPVTAGERNLYVDSDGRTRPGFDHVVTSIECGACI